MNPFARALHDYHAGDQSAEFIIERNDGFRECVPASLFFAKENFPELEARALDLCQGRILDVGAAAGRHSLELARRGFRVTSLDVLPELESLLGEAGAERIVISDILAFEGGPFETLLMLMNGIGMAGTPDGLVRFLRHARQIVSPGGQILCDSLDVTVTAEPAHIAYRQRNITEGRAPGQQTFTITCDGVTGEIFHWLHLDFDSLNRACAENGWASELVASEANGHYLCRIRSA